MTDHPPPHLNLRYLHSPLRRGPRRNRIEPALHVGKLFQFDRMNLVGKPDLLQHDRHFFSVGRVPGVQLNYSSIPFCALTTRLLARTINTEMTKHARDAQKATA